MVGIETINGVRTYHIQGAPAGWLQRVVVMPSCNTPRRTGTISRSCRHVVQACRAGAADLHRKSFADYCLWVATRCNTGTTIAIPTNVTSAASVQRSTCVGCDRW